MKAMEKEETKRQEAAEKSEKKLARKIRMHYMNRGTLADYTPKNGKIVYNVINGRKFHALEETVDNKIAKWAENVINQI
jgi:site-specific DNA-adenine methylase